MMHWFKRNRAANNNLSYIVWNEKDVSRRKDGEKISIGLFGEVGTLKQMPSQKTYTISGKDQGEILFSLMDKGTIHLYLAGEKIIKLPYKQK